MPVDGESEKQRARHAASRAPEFHASPAEIQTAVMELSQPALLRLRSYARFRMRIPAAAAGGRDSEDLLSEALTLTLAGQRRWNKQAVDLVGHLCGVMRSVSSHWAEEQRLSQLDDDAPAAARDTLALEAREELERIEAWFADDPEVKAVIAAYGRGATGPEIKAELGLTQTGLETIVKRLRRGATRLREKDES